MSDKMLLKTSKITVYDRTYDVQGKTQSSPVIDHPGAVCILPIFPDGRVLLICNRRAAVNQELIELPAGTLEPGEAPENTARRELQEETGYHAKTMKALLQFWMSPGILRERMHLFLAQGLTPGPQSLQEGERIRPLVIHWGEALAMVESGRIQDAKTIAGLLYFDLFRRRDKAIG